MRRLFAMLALLAGGLANEAVHPLVCTLTAATRRENLDPNHRRRHGARGPAQRGV
jgi:hypothetical protein